MSSPSSTTAPNPSLIDFPLTHSREVLSHTFIMDLSFEERQDITSSRNIAIRVNRAAYGFFILSIITATIGGAFSNDHITQSRVYYASVFLVFLSIICKMTSYEYKHNAADILLQRV